MEELTGRVFAGSDGAGVAVRASLEGGTLVAVERGDEPRTFRFPLDSCEIAFGGAGDEKLVLRTPEATFYGDRRQLEPLLRGTGLAAVERALGSEARRLSRGRWLEVGIWAFLAACVVMVVVGAGWVADRAVERVPVSWEAQLGKVLLEQASAGWQEVEDPAVRGAVEQMASRLLEGAPEHGYDFQFKVVRDDTVNAFALPGGGIVLFTGLLEEAERPEEVAGVLAHEIQHVLRRHSLRSAFHHLKWRLLAAMVVGDLGALEEILLAHATGLLELSYGRDMEREADSHGVDLMVRAGIDPTGMSDFFGKLAEREGAATEALAILSTHPPSRERQEFLEQKIVQVDQQRFEPLDLEWEDLQSRIKGGVSER